MDLAGKPDPHDERERMKRRPYSARDRRQLNHTGPSLWKIEISTGGRLLTTIELLAVKIFHQAAQLAQENATSTLREARERRVGTGGQRRHDHLVILSGDDVRQCSGADVFQVQTELFQTSVGEARWRGHGPPGLWMVHAAGVVLVKETFLLKRMDDSAQGEGGIHCN